MNPLPNSKSGILHTSFWAVLAIQTIGRTKRGLPPPRVYAGIFVLWFVLGLISGLGRQPARFAGGISILVLLTVLLGKAGTTTLGWLGGFGAKLGLVSNEETAEAKPEKGKVI